MKSDWGMDTEELTQPYAAEPLTQESFVYASESQEKKVFRECDFLDDETLAFIQDNRWFVERFQVYCWRLHHPGKEPDTEKGKRLLAKYPNVTPLKQE